MSKEERLAVPSQDDDDHTDDHDDETRARAVNDVDAEIVNDHGATSLYKSKKPLWWKQCGRGKPTKGQKKAMQAMASTHQLPRLGYGKWYDWKTVFGSSSSSSSSGGDSVVGSPSWLQLWVEIGCGTGENLLALAERNPQHVLVGAEMHSSGIGNCFQRIYQATQRQRYWKDYTIYSLEREEQCQTLGAGNVDETVDQRNVNYNDDALYSSEPLTLTSSSKEQGPYPNLRIFAGNGVKVLQASPTGSLDVVLITFPDPFPNLPAHRLLQIDVLVEISRALRSKGGRLVIATDHDGHAAWAAEQVEQHNHDHPCRRDGQQEESLWKKIHVTTALRTLYLPVVSKYEEKGWREGRTTKLLLYERITNDEETSLSVRVDEPGD